MMAERVKNSHCYEGHTCTQLSLKNVLRIVSPVTNWRCLGTELDISYSEIEKIDAMGLGPVSDCKWALLGHWLKTDANASWERLSTALENTGNIHSSKAIKETYLSSDEVKKSCCSADSIHMYPNGSYAIALMDKYTAALKSYYAQDVFGCSHDLLFTDANVKNFNLILLNKAVVERDTHLLNCCAMYGGVGGALDAVDSSITIDQVVSCSDTCLHPRCILVVGAPSAGKSSLSCELCRRWSKGDLLGQYDLVLLLRLRDRHVFEARKLKDLFYSCNDDRSTIIKEVKKNSGQGMLVILDGYDEGTPELYSNSTLLTELLSGTMLPDATLLVTTTPSMYADVQSCCRNRGVNQHIEILGMTTNDIRLFTQSSLSEHTNGLEKFNQFCIRSPIFLNGLHIPMNLPVLVDMCRTVFVEANDVIMTSTQLCTALVFKIISQHLDGHQIKSLSELPVHAYNTLVALGQVAYKNIANNTTIFSVSNLPGIDTLGLINTLPDLYCEETFVTTTCSFLSTAIQQYLAGFFLSTCTPLRQIEIVRAVKEKKELRMMEGALRFWAGLSGYQTVFPLVLEELPFLNQPLGIEDIWMLYETGSIETMHCYPEVTFETDPSVGLVPLDYYILGYCISHSNNKWYVKLSGSNMSKMAGDMFVMGATVSSASESNIARLWIEGFDPSPCGLRSFLACHVCEKMKELILINDAFNYETAEVLVTSLQNLHSLESLCLSGNPHFSHFKTVMKAIAQHGKIQRLRLGGVVGDYTSLVELLTFPSTLRLLHCPHNMVPSRQLECIMSVLGDNSALQELSLSHSKFSPQSTEILASVLRINSALKVLDLQYCNLQSTGVCVLAESLQCNSSLSELNLSGNRVEELGASAVADMLKKNNSLLILHLKDSNISPKGASMLALSLCQNKALVTLDICNNPIEKEGILATFSMLSSNRILTDFKMSTNLCN